VSSCFSSHVIDLRYVAVNGIVVISNFDSLGQRRPPASLVVAFPVVHFDSPFSAVSPRLLFIEARTLRAIACYMAGWRKRKACAGSGRRRWLKPTPTTGLLHIWHDKVAHAQHCAFRDHARKGAWLGVRASPQLTTTLPSTTAGRRTLQADRRASPQRLRARPPIWEAWPPTLSSRLREIGPLCLLAGRGKWRAHMDDGRYLPARPSNEDPNRSGRLGSGLPVNLLSGF